MKCTGYRGSRNRGRVGSRVLANYRDTRWRAEFGLEVLVIDIAVKRVLHLGGSEQTGGKAVGSMLKVRGLELQQKLTDMLVEVLGDYSALLHGSQ